MINGGSSSSYDNVEVCQSSYSSPVGVSLRGYQTGSEGLSASVRGGRGTTSNFQEKSCEGLPSSSSSQLLQSAAVEANPNLYVHNVPKDSHEDELRTLFGRYGTVERIRLKVNQKVGPHAVYAFVTFSKTEEAQLALNKLQGAELRGRSLRIEFQRTTSSTAGSASWGGFAVYEGNHTSPDQTGNSILLPSKLGHHQFNHNRIATDSTTIAPTMLRDNYAHQRVLQDMEPTGWNSPPPQQQHVYDWGAPPHRTATQLPASAATADYMPPPKRSRYHSPSQQQGEHSPRTTAASPSSQQQELEGILAALRSIVSNLRPEALHMVQSLTEVLLPSQWPPSDLTPAQQQLARNRAIILDPVTNRWKVALSPILEPMKPGLFTRRSVMRRASPPQMPYQPPKVIEPAVAAEPTCWQQHPPQILTLPHAGTARTSTAPPPQPDALPTTNLPEEATQWSKRLARMEITNTEDRAVVWNGILARNEKKKMPVVMKRLAGTIDNFLPTKGSVLNISHRSALEEMFKKQLGAVGIVEASSPEGLKSFQEYINYFSEKNRAGVVRLERSDYQMVYLIPTTVPGISEVMRTILPSAPSDCLLAILGRQNQGGGVATGQEVQLAEGGASTTQEAPAVEEPNGPLAAAAVTPSPASEQPTKLPPEEQSVEQQQSLGDSANGPGAMESSSIQ